MQEILKKIELATDNNVVTKSGKDNKKIEIILQNMNFALQGKPLRNMSLIKSSRKEKVLCYLSEL